MSDLVDRVVLHYQPDKADPIQLADAVREVELIDAGGGVEMQPSVRRLAAHLRTGIGERSPDRL